MDRKVVTIVGARPQFVKAAPVSIALRRYFREVLVNTGQHYDPAMSDVFFTELSIPAPDYNLGIGSGTHGDQTGRMLSAVEKVLIDEKPDWVLVYGDTNSTLAGALAAAKLHIPVAHVEAGLRSYNRKMPEEVNRVVTDHLSQMLFAPSKAAVESLRREGLTQGVHVVGDVMYDTILLSLQRSNTRHTLQSYDLHSGDYYLLTVHRAENADDPNNLLSILIGIAKLDLPVIFPVHPRTRTRLHDPAIQAVLTGTTNIQLIDPVGYLDMLALEQGARVVITDSGGVQKEAFLLGVPCVTLRGETEWTETVEAGWNTLVGCDSTRILHAVLSTTTALKTHRPDVYGDGHAAERIATLLKAQTPVAPIW